MSEESVFLAALGKSDPKERQSFLEEVCAEDEPLRRRVDALLVAFEANNKRADSDLKHPSALMSVIKDLGLHRQFTLAEIKPGAIIADRYLLIEPVGEGGMGAVWLAEQFAPVKRRVAIKLIREDTDSRELLNRFEAERQALALMDHPHIAKVLDGGLTDSGLPFFVMELVPGFPLTEYCDQNRLNISQRLELFVRICRAVHHAHQKGSETVQHSGQHGRRKSDAQNHRLRHCQGDTVRTDGRKPGHANRCRHRHLGIHVSRAGRFVLSGHRYSFGCVFPGSDPVRIAHRISSIRQLSVQPCLPGRDIAHSSR